MAFQGLTNGYIVAAAATTAESLAAEGRAMRRAVYIGIIAVLVVASIVVILFSRSPARLLRRLQSGPGTWPRPAIPGTASVEADTSIEEIRNVADAVNRPISGTAGTVRGIPESASKVLSRAEDMSAASEQSSASVQEVINLVGKVSKNTHDTVSAIEEANAGGGSGERVPGGGWAAAAESGEQAQEISMAAEQEARRWTK